LDTIAIDCPSDTLINPIRLTQYRLNNMLTKTEQLLIIELHDAKKNKQELSSFYSNERSLYRSALKLKLLDLLKYDSGEFNLTFRGWFLSHILVDIKRMEDVLNENKG